jgi:hypothetical protein
VCYSACWVNHDRVRHIHELIESEFMNEGISFQLVPFKEEGFLSLKGFVIESPCWDLWDVQVQ